MITTNTTYNNLIANGAAYEWRVVNGSNTWTKENLISGKLSSTLFERISIGNAISSQLDLQLRNVSVDQNSPVVLQFRATQNDGASVSPWYTKGTFYLDTVESSPYSEITKITAFDALIKAEITYMLQGTWSAKTALAVMNAIAADIGVAVESSTASYISANPITLTASPNIGSDGTTKRQMLGYIAAMYGGNFRINAANKLELVRANVSATNTATVGDAVKDFDASEKETIGKIRVWSEGQTYYAEPGLPLLTEAGEPILTEKSEPILVYAGQFIDEWEALAGQVLDVNLDMYASLAMAERIYDIFNGISYQPFDCPFAFVDPKYEVGDGISIKDITSVIGNMELDITPLAPSKVDFGKTEVLNNKYTYQPSFQRSTTYQLGTIPQKITDAVQNQTSLITGGFGGYIKYTFLSDGTPSEMLIMDSDKESTASSIIRLNRNGIGFSTDGGKTYTNAWTIDGHLSADFMDTGTLNAAIIAANSIAVSKLTGSIANGNWKIDLDNGTFTIGNISANNITTGTLSADRIAANSIAVSKLTGSIANGNWTIDLTNGTLTIGNITADKITTGTISDATGKNSWNLNTGQLITTQGKIGGFTIDSEGLKSNTVQSLFTVNSVLTPIQLTMTSKYDSDNYTSAGLSAGQLDLISAMDGNATKASIYASRTYITMADPSQGTQSILALYGANAIAGKYGNIAVVVNDKTYATDISLLGTTATITGRTTVYGNFTVSSGYTKSKEIETDDYGKRLLYCYETPVPMFGDIGEGVIGEDGTAYVWLDPIFAETINNYQYQVNITPYGAGECYIAERKGAYFVVKGTAGLAFGWELKAKQIDLDNKRLEKSGTEYAPHSEDYGKMAMEHIAELREEREAT